MPFSDFKTRERWHQEAPRPGGRPNFVSRTQGKKANQKKKKKKTRLCLIAQVPRRGAGDQGGANQGH